MKIRHMAAGAMLLATFAAAVGFSPRATAPAPVPAAGPIVAAATHAFKLDPVHSSSVFRIEHMGVSAFYGVFRDLSGTFVMADDPAACSFSIDVKTDSVDTRNKQRDDHLKSDAFFDAAKFATISFKSTKIEKAGDNKLKVTGDLTMHGVTKPITAEVRTWPAKQTNMGFRSGFETTVTVKRSDFGMTTYINKEGGLGDEVTVIFAGEGTGSKEG